MRTLPLQLFIFQPVNLSKSHKYGDYQRAVNNAQDTEQFDYRLEERTPSPLVDCRAESAYLYPLCPAKLMGHGQYALWGSVDPSHVVKVDPVKF